MNLLDNIWEAIKRYPYKLWTIVFLLVTCMVFDNFVDSQFLNILEYVLFGGISVYILSAFAVGVKNTWLDGDKVEAVVFGILGTGMIALVTYLIFFL